jgi:hypothetical protein
VRAGLRERATTEGAVFQKLATTFAGGARPPYDFAVVDEAQDLSVTQMRFFAALGGVRPDALFFAGTSGSASSASRSPGAPWAWTSEGGRARCA